ncbi:hypothetical protein, partial [Xanthomonas citri]|uniref:hypothetical protein n=1 Tax=Xanthomonas citri TaxID=346 RepID=UPI001CBDC896
EKRKRKTQAKNASEKRKRKTQAKNASEKRKRKTQAKNAKGALRRPLLNYMLNPADRCDRQPTSIQSQAAAVSCVANACW